MSDHSNLMTTHPPARTVPRWLASRCKQAFGCRLRYALQEIQERYPTWARNGHCDGEQFVCEPSCLFSGDLAEVLDFATAVDAIVLVGGEAQRPGCVRVAFQAAEPRPPAGKGRGSRIGDDTKDSRLRRRERKHGTAGT